MIELETVTGYVHNILFFNESSHYVIARMKIDQKKDETVILVGYFEVPKRQELCQFIGEYVTHPRYGRQFKVTSYEKLMPEGKEAVVRFLSSSLFPGVGVRTATKIVDELGTDCLKRIQEDSKSLEAIDLKPEIKMSILRGIQKSTRLNDAVKLFVGHGIPLKYLLKMEAVYKDRIVQKVQENPYNLVRDIDGIGFRIADRIALSMGINLLDTRRIEAFILDLVKQICFSTQNTYTDVDELFFQLNKQEPNLDKEAAEEVFDHLVAREELIVEEFRIYPVNLYDAELGIAKHLASLSYKKLFFDHQHVQEDIIEIERESGITYNDEQKQAIETCLSEGVTLLTGGPGTGKTTVVNAIIRILERRFSSANIVLTAPTGRSAKRLSELSERSATTIHRLLKWDLETNHFACDASNPIEGDILIVDEFSMVDTQLFYHLLEATSRFQKILLIGDDEQLPPVSPGDVLRDLLLSKSFATVRLIQIHRQAEQSGIIPLAYQMRNGHVVEQDLIGNDVNFHSCHAAEAGPLVLRAIEQAVEVGYTQQDIQVLAPMYDGVAGIRNINRIIRDYFNSPTELKKEIMIGSTTYREGDKILQLKNQPDDDIYNGDIGFITEIVHKEDDYDRQDRILVDFEGRLVAYSGLDFQNITHAYCISVHKSQGSEYAYVIMLIFKDYRQMLRRKLLYTGVTRAKQQLLLIGEFEAFAKGVKHLERAVRKTTLQLRIQQTMN